MKRWMWAVTTVVVLGWVMPALAGAVEDQMQKLIQEIPQRDAMEIAREAVEVVEDGSWQGAYAARPLIKALFEAGKYEAMEPVAAAALATSTYFNQEYQTLRMKAFLQRGEKTQALRAAKTLYAIARFKETAAAVGEIAQCLKEAHPEGELAAQRFRMQQQQASRQPGAGDAGDPATQIANPLADSAGEASVFEVYYNQLDANRRNSPAAGHLLLLMDRSAQAEPIFAQAWKNAARSKRTDAAEDLAKAMRAKDGGIGRALAFLESLEAEAEKAAEPSPTGENDVPPRTRKESAGKGG